MLIERNPAADLGQEPFKPDLARPQFLWTVVDAVVFQQVEGIEEHPVVIRPAVQLLKDGQASVVAINGLAVDRDRARLLRRRSVPDQWISVTPVIAAPGEQTHPVVLAHDETIPIMLDLVEPPRSHWRPGGP